MSSVEVKTTNEAAPGVRPVDMKLEVVMIGVTDIDRAKAFYQSLGWRFDGDHLARRAADFGVLLGGEVRVDMKRVKARADALVAESRRGVELWLRGMAGCTVIEGHARFEGRAVFA